MKTFRLFTILLLFIPLHAGGTIWRDNFEGEKLKSCWKPRGSFFKWEVKDGFLYAKQVVSSNLLLTPLQLTAFPGSHRHLSIIVLDIKASLTGRVGFGIGLGKTFPEVCPVSNCRLLYIFALHRIQGIWAMGGGRFAPFPTWDPRCPGKIWRTKVLKEIRVEFDSGRFQMIADGEVRADFKDPHFNEIDYIVFSISGIDPPGGAQGWAGSFEISGPSITGYDVKPEDKLATTWGSIKGR